MKETAWIIAFHQDVWSKVQYKVIYAATAQEAVDKARFEWRVYEVIEVYKKTRSWK